VLYRQHRVKFLHIQNLKYESLLIACIVHKQQSITNDNHTHLDIDRVKKTS